MQVPWRALPSALDEAVAVFSPAPESLPSPVVKPTEALV